MIVPLQASAIVRKEEAKAAELQRREGLNEERSALHSTIESEFVEEIALGRRGGAVTEVNAKKLKGFVEEVSTADGPGIIAHGRAWELLEKHVNVSNVTLNCCHVRDTTHNISTAFLYRFDPMSGTAPSSLSPPPAIAYEFNVPNAEALCH